MRNSPMKTRLFAEELYDLVRQIPAGRVAAYGDLARLMGLPYHARLVGRLLSRAPAGTPCHRVVDASGRTVPGWDVQRLRLEEEGVSFRPSGRVDMRRARWEAAAEGNGSGHCDGQYLPSQHV